MKNPFNYNLFFDRMKGRPIFYRGLRNASYSTAEYLITSALYIFVTPFLIRYLGIGQYGILVLAGSLAGLLGVFDFGLSEAMVKYISSFNARKDSSSVLGCVQLSFVIYAAIAAGIIFLGCLFAPYLGSRILKVTARDVLILIKAIRLSSIALSIQIVRNALLSVINAFERYDLSSKINIWSVASVTILSVALVYLGHGIISILYLQVFCGIIYLIYSLIVVKKLLPDLALFRLRIKKGIMKKMFSFSFFKWIHSAACVVFSNADNVIIGVYLGPVVLSYYSVTLQAAQQINNLVAKAFTCVFPMISSENERMPVPELGKLYHKALFLSIIFSSVITLMLLLNGKFLLSVWMGKDFAVKTHNLLYILCIYFYLISINNVPHNMLLGIGDIRFIALTIAMWSAISLAWIVLLIPFFGVFGVATGKFIIIFAIFFNLMRIRNKMARTEYYS